jgi:hypothetical protein
MDKTIAAKNLSKAERVQDIRNRLAAHEQKCAKMISDLRGAIGEMNVLLGERSAEEFTDEQLTVISLGVELIEMKMQIAPPPFPSLEEVEEKARKL